MNILETLLIKIKRTYSHSIERTLIKKAVKEIDTIYKSKVPKKKDAKDLTRKQMLQCSTCKEFFNPTCLSEVFEHEHKGISTDKEYFGRGKNV